MIEAYNEATKLGAKDLVLQNSYTSVFTKTMHTDFVALVKARNIKKVPAMQSLISEMNKKGNKVRYLIMKELGVPLISEDAFLVYMKFAQPAICEACNMYVPIEKNEPNPS